MIKYFSGVRQVSPSSLSDGGVAVTRVVQKVGHFVIVFPEVSTKPVFTYMPRPTPGDLTLYSFQSRSKAPSSSCLSLSLAPGEGREETRAWERDCLCFQN